MGVHQNLLRDVRITAKWNPSTRAIGKKVEQAWIQAKHHNTRILDSRMAPYILITLVVDDVCVKYVRREDAEHLLEILQRDYNVTPDWQGDRYIGLTLDWDYQNRQVHFSMSGYIRDALIKFKHPPPRENKTCRIHTLHQSMAPRSNTQRPPTIPPFWERTRQNSSSVLWENSTS